MNTRHLLAAASAFAFSAGTAMAGEATNFDIPPSTKSRAEVRAELERAGGAYAIDAGEASFTVQPASRASRADIHAQADQGEPLNVQHYVGE